MAQVSADSCGNLTWGSGSRCHRLKKHNGWHERYGERWADDERLPDDNGDANNDRKAQRKGKFPDYRVVTHILNAK